MYVKHLYANILWNVYDHASIFFRSPQHFKITSPKSVHPSALWDICKMPAWPCVFDIQPDPNESELWYIFYKIPYDTSFSRGKNRIIAILQTD